MKRRKVTHIQHPIADAFAPAVVERHALDTNLPNNPILKTLDKLLAAADSATARWTFEIKYESAERGIQTGYAVLRDPKGDYAGTVLKDVAAQIVAALNPPALNPPTKAMCQRFAVFSYDPDQQQWFTDIIPATDSEAAETYACALRPYVTSADAWPSEQLDTLAERVRTVTEDAARGELQNVAEESDVEICRTCYAVYDQYGDGYDGECPECADKREEKKEAVSS